MKNYHIHDISKVIFIIFMIFLSGCKDVPNFPVKYVYEYIPNSQECYQYEVISQDPLKVSDGVLVTMDKCSPSLMGFQIDDAAEAFQYIRDLQELAKKRCK